MHPAAPLHQAHLSGFRHFFTPAAIETEELTLRGIGVQERMLPCAIARPRGTGDFLLMLFHGAAFASAHAGEETLNPSQTLMIWPTGKGQFYGNHSSGFRHTWIHCEGRRLRRILRETRLPLLRPFPISDPSSFEQTLLAIHGEAVSYSRPDPVIVANLLENCLRDLARRSSGPQQQSPTPEALLRVSRWMGTAPATRVNLSMMASMAGMSVSHFCLRFKRHFGLSPMDYLIKHRMHHASHLLSNRNLSITEIARQVGYEDLFHFSKSFKKHFGCSPREMRLRAGG